MNELCDTKVGDIIAINTGGWGTHVPVRRTVAKTTSTQIVLDDGSRWTRRSGKRVGAGTSSWTREWAAPWNESDYQERKAELEHKQRRNTVRNFFQSNSCDALTEEQWQQVAAICDEAAKVSAQEPK